jgi:hypothetical protein
VSRFHCACGFAIDHAEQFADHMHQAFARDDDTGSDGQAHYERADPNLAAFACACGFTATKTADFDDHLLLVFLTPDSIGTDGEKRTPADPSTPDRWHVRENQ